MSLIQFASIGSGVILYPDDIRLFRNTRYYPSLGMVVGDYSGALPLDDYVGEWPIKDTIYRTLVRPGELIGLLNDDNGAPTRNYASIYREAYPQGNKPEDDVALEFLERAKFPTSADGLIDVTTPLVLAAMEYFRDDVKYAGIDQDVVDRVIQGVPE